MNNPTHRLKKFTKDKSLENSAVIVFDIEERGWLGSGIKDKNGVEIFEGDIARNCFNTAVVEFRNGSFYLNGDDLFSYAREDLDLEVVGHIATEEINEHFRQDSHRQH